MVHCINNGLPSERHDLHGLDVKQTQHNIITSLVIPMVLCNYEEALQTECRRLHFADVRLLNRNEIPSTLRIAKLIIDGNHHRIRIGDVEDLDFDEIDYDFNFKGTSIKGSHKKDDATVEKMSEEERDEIQKIVQQSFSVDSDDENTDSSIAADERKSAVHLHLRPRFNQSITVAALTILANANLNSQTRKKKREEQRRLDEKAAIARDNRKRAEAKREARWQLRQLFYTLKAEKLERILTGHRKAERNRRIAVSSTALSIS